MSSTATSGLRPTPGILIIAVVYFLSLWRIIKSNRGNMKLRLLSVLATLVICVGGCNRTKPVKVLAERWGVGEHQDCVYARQTLYCVQRSLEDFDRFFLPGIMETDKKPLTRTDALSSLSVDVVHYMERKRSKLEQDPSTGTYEVKFSSSPSNYALWDCYKTGSGSPEMDCRLTNEADRNVAKREEMAEMDDVLLDLLPETLAKKCGAPQKTSNPDDISISLVSPSVRPNVSVEFTFFTHNAVSIDTVQVSDARSFWFIDHDSIELAPDVMKALPCLLKQ